MIVEQKKYLRWIWFADRPGHDLSSVYLQTKERVFRWTHIRRPFHTMVIDLEAGIERIMANYGAKGAYKIRRAEKDGLRHEVARNEAALLELFSLTARVKRLQGLSSKDLRTKPDSVMTQIVKDNEILAVHFYLLDKQGGRVLLLYSASAYRKYQAPEKRYLAGRAHRLLVHLDLIYFIAAGYRRYDFGGYDPDSSDPAVVGVNKFKEDFGGQVVRQYQYYPRWYYVFRRLRFWLRSLIPADRNLPA